MKNIIKILMNRDGVTHEEAKEMCEECREAMLEAIEAGYFTEAEEIIRCDLGLEPDYIFDLI